MVLRLSLLAGVLALAAAQAASALTFSLAPAGQSAPNGNVGTFSAQAGGLTLTVDAFSGAPTDETDLVTASLSPASVFADRGEGVGVQGGAAQNRLGEGEILRLSFSTSVVLDELVFVETGQDDEVLIFDNAGAFRNRIAVAGAADDLAIVNVAGGGVEGDVFFLGGTGTGNGLGVLLNAVSITVVPIPASFALLLGALGVLGVAARRRA